MVYKRFLIRLLSFWCVLLVPFVGHFFTEEIQWNQIDYIVAALLLGGAAAVSSWIDHIQLSKKSKSVLIVLFLIFFLLIWAELAVGLFGSPLAGS